MKKILCTAVSALALATFADGVNSTEFGVLTVPSTAEETIVSVPWLASGTGSEGVKVCDLVLTAGLTAAAEGVTGDTLKYWNGSTWDAWVLMTDQSGNKVWTPSTGGATADTPVVRGLALLLKRPNATTRADKFYIMGKPTDAGETTELGTGYTLVAPPSTTETLLNDTTKITWANIAADDKILLPSTTAAGKTTEFAWILPSAGGSVTNWCRWAGAKAGGWVADDKVKIPAGVGAWFINGGKGTGTKSFTYGTK